MSETPTIVRIGNADALEAVMVWNPATGSSQKVFRGAPGERVTELYLEPGLNRMQQLSAVIRFLQEMMSPTAVPWWIECDDEPLRMMLCEHYGLRYEKVRPPQWGDGTTTAPPPEKKARPAKKAAAKGKDA